MFWSRYNSLCESKGKKTNPVGKEIGVVSSTINKWKNGAVPSADILLRIADYFDVTVDYLLGRDTKKASPSEDDELTLKLLKENPNLRKVVDEFIRLPLEDQMDVVEYLSFRKSRSKAD